MAIARRSICRPAPTTQSNTTGAATPGAIEIGGKIRNAHKFSENERHYVQLERSYLAPLSMFPLKQTVNNFYNGSYKAPPGYQLQQPSEFL